MKNSASVGSLKLSSKRLELEFLINVDVAITISRFILQVNALIDVLDLASHSLSHTHYPFANIVVQMLLILIICLFDC
jgi:hypothetical protein